MGRYKSPMSNELLIVAVAVGLGIVAIRFARFMILDDPSLKDLQQPADSTGRVDDTEVGR